jgi:outer membrane protein assembly factor BamA
MEQGKITNMRPSRAIVILLVLLFLGSSAQSQSKFYSPDDGWFDMSGFLDQRYGFLPVLVPITEPAVGYGAGLALAFIDKPLGAAKSGLDRPNISAVGGLYTDNESWGALVGDSRYWFNDRLQSTAGVAYASVNLDFYGIGDDALLRDNPLRYNLESRGGLVRGKIRLGNTRLWGGLQYAFLRTTVSFEAPAETPSIPDHENESDAGGITPSVFFDSRDNIFTPTRGAYVEVTAGIFGPALGGDDEFQRVQLVALEYIPLSSSLYLGLRADGTASFGDQPFYMMPFISLRGAPVMRYQGEQVAQVEAELRWQFWRRLSLLGFAGYGAAWNDFEQVENEMTVVTGGPGFRYELAREYGIHAGVDLAFGPDETAIYFQVGNAWPRP